MLIYSVFFVNFNIQPLDKMVNNDRKVEYLNNLSTIYNTVNEIDIYINIICSILILKESHDNINKSFEIQKNILFEKLNISSNDIILMNRIKNDEYIREMSNLMKVIDDRNKHDIYKYYNNEGYSYDIIKKISNIRDKLNNELLLLINKYKSNNLELKI